MIASMRSNIRRDADRSRIDGPLFSRSRENRRRLSDVARIRKFPAPPERGGEERGVSGFGRGEFSATFSVTLRPLSEPARHATRAVSAVSENGGEREREEKRDGTAEDGGKREIGGRTTNSGFERTDADSEPNRNIDSGVNAPRDTPRIADSSGQHGCV